VFVAHLAAGDATSYALTGDGKLYSWGKGKFGALGLDIEDDEDPEGDVWKARVIKAFGATAVVTVSAGYQHVAALTKGNRIYLWGRNNHGQLGLTEENDGQTKLVAPYVGEPAELKMRKQESIMKIVCGHSHTNALIEVTRPDMRTEITGESCSEWSAKQSEKAPR